MDILRKIARILIAPLAFIDKYFKAVLLLLVVLVFIISMQNVDSGRKPNLAKLYIDASIYETESYAEEIENIKDNDIRGVLLVIDSPGGTLSASVELADMMRRLSEEIPVVAYAQGSMASGSYYAGMYAKEIYANGGSIIGSIGVIYDGKSTKELMDKIGIKDQTIKAGAYKEVGTSSREWTDEERAFVENLVNEHYTMFWQSVLAAREHKLTSKDYRIFAEGKIFSANTAQNLGLIDKVGYMDDAIEALKKYAEVDEAIWLKKDKVETYMDKFLSMLSIRVASMLKPSLKASL